jgi:sodium/hydrogen exchanger 8
VFAVIGTIISTIIVSVLLMYLGSIGMSVPMPFAESFMFGSLISAVDPVATLAVFAHVGAPEQLNSILAGESILNDAVAIVLYRYCHVSGVHLCDGVVSHWMGGFFFCMKHV